MLKIMMTKMKNKDLDIRLCIEAPTIKWISKDMGSGQSRYDLTIINPGFRLYTDIVASIFCFNPQQYMWYVYDPMSSSHISLYEGTESGLDAAMLISQKTLEDAKIITIRQ